MPLTNKFLRYSPEITLEIFTLVWDKLINCGWKNTLTNKLELTFEEFQERGTIRYDGDKKFFQYSSIVEDFTETTVQEILGYDPFVKDDFVLPKKWCIKSQSRDQDYLINEFARSCGGGHWNDEDNHARNNYLNISDGEYHRGSRTLDKEFTEITFDQFKKYVLKESIETSKETNPEYVECINIATCNTKVGEIFKCRHSNGYFEFEYNDKSKKNFNSWDGWSDKVWSNVVVQKYFKPSTREAFDAQNKPIKDTIECEECNGTGEIMIAKLYPNGHTEVNEECLICGGEGIIDKPKQPLKQAVHCTTQEEWNFVTKKLGNDGTNWFKDPNWGNNKSFCISFEGKNQSQTLDFYTNAGYQILSFQEWYDLNGYKMEKEVKFEVGKWYKVVYKDTKQEYYLKHINNKYEFGYSEYILISNGQHSLFYSGNDLNIMSIPIKVSIGEIQQYLPDDHPDKIKIAGEFEIGDWVCHRGLKTVYQIIKFDRDGWAIGNVPGGGWNSVQLRHATPEEINNHLISIGQIPVGEPLNNGIEPNKDGGYSCISANREGNPQCTFNSIKINGQEILKPKMILSIDDEELPMVNIIKTNTIKQLLNND